MDNNFGERDEAKSSLGMAKCLKTDPIMRKSLMSSGTRGWTRFEGGNGNRKGALGNRLYDTFKAGLRSQNLVP